MFRRSLIRACLILAVVFFSGDRHYAKSESLTTASVLSLDGNGWVIATDPQNAGRDQNWSAGPRPDAKSVEIPATIQSVFPGYHGVAWYWKHFVAPSNDNTQGRYILRFWAVDYKADVWVNGVGVGGHEGGETPFEVDITDAVKHGGEHVLAVRVLNPTSDPIDGIALYETPHAHKQAEFPPGNDFNDGGIVDSIELITAPAVRITDVFVQPDMHTGKIQIEATVHNTTDKKVNGEITFSVADASGGMMLDITRYKNRLDPGDTVLKSELQVQNHRLWQLDDPYLYRVNTAVKILKLSSVDELTRKCGFREFVFKDGYFRLNGKRIFLKGSIAQGMIGTPTDLEWHRRILLYSKAFGANMIRYIAGIPNRKLLDYADEIGLMVYEEPMASWCMAYSEHFNEWYDRSMRRMILRDRNHPCVTIWGLLNETSDGAIVRHAIKTLNLVRTLDSSRMALFSSGRWDNLQNSSASLPAGVFGWSTGMGINPCILFNSTDQPIEAAGAEWQPGQLGMLAGLPREESVLRWTAPAKGEYEITARFVDASQKSSTAGVSIMHNKKILFDSGLNMKEQGKEQHFSGSCSVEQNDVIDFRVNNGEQVFMLPFGILNFVEDAVDLEVVIRSPDGKSYHAANEFSPAKNPNGPWSYGMLYQQDKEKDSIFQLYTVRLEGDVPGVGMISNPGSMVWENVLEDWHDYLPPPHSAKDIQKLRTMNDGRPVFLSEYGVGSGVNWIRLKQYYPNNRYAKSQCEKFLADYQKWNMNEAFGRPEEFFIQSLTRMANLRIVGHGAVRANPHVVGHLLSGIIDDLTGGGFLGTFFQELKPGSVDAVVDVWSTLRWCAFVEPWNVYRGGKIKLEAVLANEDVLAPGDYPVNLWVFDADNKIVWQRDITVTIADSKISGEQPFATAMFSEDVVMDVPEGKYRFVVNFETAAATGGQSDFYVLDAAEMPAVDQEVVLWGEDAELSAWLTQHGIQVRPFDPAVVDKRELLLVSSKPAAAGGSEAFSDLAKRIARGSSAVFLVPSVLKKDEDTGGWIPLADKPKLEEIWHWIFHPDEWAKKHPIFAGLQCGGLMDYTYYRELIADPVWSGGQRPSEAVAGSNDVCWSYKSGLLVAIYKLGAGRFTLNTLPIRDNLGKVPQAERLLRNMLNEASGELDQPVTALPENFDDSLKAMGY